jgi:hypothetical protein
VHGHGYGKRSADAEPGYGYGHATSYSHRSPPRVCMDTMSVMDMVVMVMARGLLMLDTMVVPVLMFNRAVLTTMDLMAMV